MIIEAGYDLTTLLFDGARDSGELRIVMLDSELRALSAQSVVPRFDGSLGTATLEAVDAAIPEPDEDDDEVSARYAVRYVALGYRIPSIEGYPEGFDWDRVRVFDEWLGCRGITLLGIQVSDGERWASSGPMHRFEDYALDEELPRVLVIPGPHPFLTCECAACAPRRARWQRARSTQPDSEPSP
jgi:hypothetical protein